MHWSHDDVKFHKMFVNMNFHYKYLTIDELFINIHKTYEER
jgi:hypothetical protein